MGGGMRDRPAANEAVSPVDRGMALVAEDGNGDVALMLLALLIDLGLRELHGPARVPVLLPQLRVLVLPSIRYLARFDIGLLIVGVSLLRSGHDRRVYDLTAHGQIPGFREMAIETGEQVLDGASLHAVFPEQPDRLGVRHLVAQPQSEKAHERQTVLDL